MRRRKRIEINCGHSRFVYFDFDFDGNINERQLTHFHFLLELSSGIEEFFFILSPEGSFSVVLHVRTHQVVGSKSSHET